MTNRIYSTGAVVLALAFPLAVFADVTGTQTLNSGQQLNLAAGTVVSSGGDIQWTGSAISFLGGAKGFDVPGSGGASTYAALTQATVQAFVAGFSTAPIPSSSLVVGNIFGVQTGSGTLAKLMVTAASGGSITLQFDAFGVSGGGPGPGSGGNSPSITAVQDAGSYTDNIAQGSIFVVKGTNLSPSGLGTNGLDSASYPLLTSLGNVSISFMPTTGGSATAAYMVYLFNNGTVNQLAALLPSTVTPGSYQVTVTNGSTSAPVSVQVVASKPGIVTQDSTGNGLAVVQNYNAASPTTYDVNRFTTGVVNGSTISPAHPNQIEVAWLTGMDPLPAGMVDNEKPNGGNGYDFTKNGVTVTAYVGGMAIPAAYGGRTGCCAGEDEIVFTLPGNVPTGCTVEFHVTVNGVASQSTFISIAPDANATACVLQGYTASQLQALDNGGSVTTGSFGVDQSSITGSFGGASQTLTVAAVGGEFYQYTGFELAGAIGALANALSGCTVTPIPQPGGGVFGTGTGTPLDAGTIKITGPASSGLSGNALTETHNTYNLGFTGFGATVSGNFVPGTYTLNGSGGNDVGSFSASITVPSIFTVTNVPTSVTRSAGLTLNWTGGNSSDPVIITGEAENKVNGVETGASFACFTTAGAGTYTVPASILNQLPAVTASALSGQTGISGIEVVSYVGSFSGTGFTAPLKAGGNINAFFTSSVNTITSVPYN